MKIEEAYSGALSHMAAAQKLAFEDTEARALLSRVHSAIADLDGMLAHLDKRPEIVTFHEASTQLSYGLLAASCGHYRGAYFSLRLFLELSLGAVYFSAHEIDLRQWLRNEQDIRWGVVTGGDTGVFSETFVRAFCPELQGHAKTYANLSSGVYREASEYVHANAKTREWPTKDVSYSKAAVRGWCEKADTAWLIVMFGVFARYVHFMPTSALQELDTTIRNALGHIPEVRAVLDHKQKGPENV